MTERPQDNLADDAIKTLLQLGLGQGLPRIAEMLLNAAIVELKRARWQEADLKTQPKRDSVKVALAALLPGVDDDDGGVHRRATGDGHARLFEPSLVSPEEAGRGVDIIKTPLLKGQALHLGVFRLLGARSKSRR
jgi:hypothetical protein